MAQVALSQEIIHTEKALNMDLDSHINFYLLRNNYDHINFLIWQKDYGGMHPAMKLTIQWQETTKPRRGRR